MSPTWCYLTLVDGQCPGQLEGQLLPGKNLAPGGLHSPAVRVDDLGDPAQEAHLGQPWGRGDGATSALTHGTIMGGRSFRVTLLQPGQCTCLTHSPLPSASNPTTTPRAPFTRPRDTARFFTSITCQGSRVEWGGGASDPAHPYPLQGRLRARTVTEGNRVTIYSSPRTPSRVTGNGLCWVCLGSRWQSQKGDLHHRALKCQT